MNMVTLFRKKVKYRVKEVTKNGNISYIPQQRGWLWWTACYVIWERGLFDDVSVPVSYPTFLEAFEAIGKLKRFYNRKQNDSVKIIPIED